MNEEVWMHLDTGTEDYKNFIFHAIAGSVVGETLTIGGREWCVQDYTITPDGIELEAI